MSGMKKQYLKGISTILVFLMVISMLVGCGQSASSQVQTSESETSGQTEEETEVLDNEEVQTSTGTRVIVDAVGREVEIPETVQTIVTLGSGAPRMAAYLGVMDMLVGAEDHDISGMNILRDYNPVYYELLAELPAVGSGGGSGSNNGYAEQIIMVAPDVILAGFSAEAADELQSQTGIPVISVKYISKGLANDSFYEAMEIFAEVVGAEERCEELLNYIDACKADLNARTEDIDDSEKLTAYTGAVTFSGRHGFGGTYSSFGPLDAVNAINVADSDVEDGYYEVDLEQVIVWDPDVIFLDPGNMDLVEDEYNTNPNYFDSLRAVQSGEVYTMPSFNNCSTNISYALMDAYYAGIVLFPEAFADVDIDEKAGEILTMFLGENTYDIMVENGLYYGKITIGE